MKNTHDITMYEGKCCTDPCACEGGGEEAAGRMQPDEDSMVCRKDGAQTVRWKQSSVPAGIGPRKAELKGTDENGVALIPMGYTTYANQSPGDVQSLVPNQFMSINLLAEHLYLVRESLVKTDDTRVNWKNVPALQRIPYIAMAKRAYAFLVPEDITTCASDCGSAR